MIILFFHKSGLQEGILIEFSTGFVSGGPSDFDMELLESPAEGY